MNRFTIKTLASIFTLIFLSYASPLCAQESGGSAGGEPAVLEPVVVTATRSEVPVSHVGKSISIITEGDMERENQSYVRDLLQRMPSVRTQRLGGPGAFTSLNIRGASGAQTVYLLNGLQVTDASGVNGEFTSFLGSLYLDDVERIEVLRGPQSTLYGADAVGGVVNIITRKGGGPLRVWGSAEGGSENSFKEVVNVTGGLDRSRYSFTASNVTSDGLDENDQFRVTTLSLSYGMDLTEDFSFESLLRFSDSRLEYNDQDFITLSVTDDPNQTNETSLIHWGLVTDYQIAEPLRQKAAFQITVADRDLADFPDPGESQLSLSRSSFQGRSLDVELQEDMDLSILFGSSHPLLKDNTFTVGGEFEWQDVDTSSLYFGATSSLDADKETWALFLQDQVAIHERLFLTAGLRVTDFESFGTHTTGEGSVAYLFHETGTKLRANVSSGFDDPSVFQLFDPTYGNPALKPARIVGYDLGADQSLFDDKLKLSLTYFNNDFEDLFGYDPATFVTINTGEARAEGIELEANATPVKRYTFGLTYTFNDTESSSTGGGEMPLIPDHQMGAYAHLRPHDKLGIFVDLLFVDENLIFAFPGSPVNESHTTVDISITYDLTPRWQLYGRAENLLDEKFTENGFPNPGLFAYAGFKVKAF